MKVIVTRSLMFAMLAEKAGPKGERLHTRKREVIPFLKNGQIQTVPDWIRNAPGFQHCVDAGVLQEIEIKSRPAPKAPEPVESETDSKEEVVDNGKKSKSAK